MGDAPIDYLEFGVFKGRLFAGGLRPTTARNRKFYGFDTFEGLPGIVAYERQLLPPAGHFSTQGLTPNIEDNRVRWVKGMFQDTLEGFAAAYQPRSRRILHLDADLYSSTLYTLAVMSRFLTPGTVLIFDEFDSVSGEFKAFCDYLASFSANRRGVRTLRRVLRAGGFSWIHVAMRV